MAGLAWLVDGAVSPYVLHVVLGRGAGGPASTADDALRRVLHGSFLRSVSRPMARRRLEPIRSDLIKNYLKGYFFKKLTFKLIFYRFG